VPPRMQQAVFGTVPRETRLSCKSAYLWNNHVNNKREAGSRKRSGAVKLRPGANGKT